MASSFNVAYRHLRLISRRLACASFALSKANPRFAFGHFQLANGFGKFSTATQVVGSVEKQESNECASDACFSVYERALYLCLRNHNEDGAFDIMRRIRDQYPTKMRYQYFYPIIVDYSKSASSAEIIQLLLRIDDEFKIQLAEWELNRFVFPLLSDRTKQDFMDTVRREMIDSNKAARYGYRLLRRITGDEAPETDDTREEVVVDNLPLIEDANVDTLLQQLDTVRIKGGNSKIVLKRLIFAYCAQNDAEKATEYYEELKKASSTISATLADEIASKISSISEPSKELEKFLNRVEKDSGRRSASTRSRVFEQPFEMKLDQDTDIPTLIKHLDTIRSYNGNPKVVLKRLVLAYIDQNDATNALNYYNEVCKFSSTVTPAFAVEVAKAVASLDQPSKDMMEFLKRVEKDSGMRLEMTPRKSVSMEEQMKLNEDELTVEELERHIESMKAKRLNFKSALRRLAAVYGEKEDAIGVLKTIRELESIGAELTDPTVYAMLSVAASISDADSNESKELESKLVDQLKSRDPTVVFRNFLSSFKRASMVKEAMYFMKLLERHAPWNLATFNSFTQMKISLHIEDMLSGLMDLNARDQAHTFVESAINAGYLKADKQRFQNLINASIDKNDLAAATGLFVKAASKFRFTRCVQRLMTELIQRVDAKLLQQVFDHQQLVCGDTDAKFRLAMALCHCGKVAQAQKVWNAMESPVPKASVESDFVYYTDVRTYSNLVQIVKEGSNDFIDRNRVYETLFDIYRKKKDWKSAMTMWVQIGNDKKLEPSIELYRVYARILRENDRPIPPEIEYLSAFGNTKGDVKAI